ncbi:DinB family protein [Ammoniphilus sp. YIM 78166]|uniref:DinB family protein n=1 Tax=Ammoniphilus sp. YIM 78166 TaxID=1644106 RepID=UPI0010700115|nr:DinB family protein [Ammoniphilus sp. YIM 78166]
MSQIQKNIQSINRLIDDILVAVESLTEEQVRWKPSAEAWSVQEVLCHVEEAIPYWLGEIQRVVEAPGMEWGRGLQHEGRLEAVAKADQRLVSDVAEGIRKTKEEVERVLGGLTDEALAIEAPSRNPRFGTKALSFVVDHLLVEHLETHLRQINRNVGQFGTVKPVS